MQFFPIIALCDKHAEELKEHLRPMADALDQTLQEKIVRACCDVFNGDDPDRKGCEVANHWYYLRLELSGWRLKEAGTKGGAMKTQAKAAAARANGAKGGRPKNTYFCYDCAPLSDDPDEQRLVQLGNNKYGKQCCACERAAYYRLD